MIPLLRPANPPLREWQGRRVWLIGGSSGIGAALAEQLAAAGALLILSARQPAPLAAVAARCRDAITLPLDITQPESVTAALAQLQQRAIALDVVVINAGTYQPLHATELTPETIRATLNTNLLGVLDSVAILLPTLLQQGSGHLVLVGSVAGYIGLPKSLAYGPSKAALINFAESLYLDLAPRGIAVTLVNPGFVATRLTAQNHFTMPALLQPEQAATAIMRGLARGQFEIHFPRRFTLFLKLLRLLPYRLWFALAARLTGDHDAQSR